MKILNISSIIPLPGLKRENDILIRIQDYLVKKYGYEFTVAKSLPYTPSILAKINKKWKNYREYQESKNVDVQGYKTVIYPWIMPPSSNFCINYLLVPFNFLVYKFFIKDKIYSDAKESDLLLAQNLIPDAIVTYWLAKELDKSFILNLRGELKSMWFKLPLLKKIINEAEHLITPSPSIYKSFGNTFQVKLIPHPVEERFFMKDNKDFPIPKLVSVCRLLDWKNLDRVIEALASLRDQGYRFHYKILGDGPELDKLQSMVKKYGLSREISFEGFVDYDKVPNYMKEANIYIQPSYPETLGRAFLEAAAAGCLIIGHENTGVDGIFEHDQSAIFVNKSNIKTKLGSVFDIFGNLKYHQLIESSKDKVRELNWENLGEEYNKLYGGTTKE
ncbi:glycosyltransferase family 4 protein [Gracilimonas halophila]|uniref:Glycosyltransferase family 4 protein n=1 Tax=Gracilimonas halophila TaxID=1834464 RepID=A0ABW5JMI3_9BACT